MDHIYFLLIVILALIYFFMAATIRTQKQAIGYQDISLRVRRVSIDLLKEQVRLQKALVTYGTVELEAAHARIKELEA